MGILEWFGTREVDELAAAIAAELVKRVPPGALESRTRKAAERLRNTHDAIFARAGKFARTHPLNVYKRARLGNQFRWALPRSGAGGAGLRQGSPEPRHRAGSGRRSRGGDDLL